MDTNRAASAFAALGQPTRIEAFRLLVKAGPAGMTVGGIASALGVRGNTMSAALSVLAQAGMIESRREGRSNRYFANTEAIVSLVGHLTRAPDSGDSKGEFIMPPAKNVLFLCTGNSARSLIGEAILNREGAGRFRAYSAGSDPKEGPHPYTLDLLRGLGHDISGLRSKNWDEFGGPEAPQMDFVFTVCDSAAAEICPVWPGQPVTAHWGVPDPAAVSGTEAERRLAFSEAYRMLRNRIMAFVNLPMASLDRMAQERAVAKIGATKD